jgi:hypothetical protein
VTLDKTVIGVFDVRDKAERAVAEMRKTGFKENEISIVAKGGNAKSGGGPENTGDNDVDSLGMGTTADGTTTGGVLGGLAGLAAGAGALVIPGLGPLMAAGPIAGLLSGAATGGIAGGLIDWGIPENRGQHYEGEIKKGKILAIVRTQDNKIEDAANIMRSFGARDVETH